MRVERVSNNTFKGYDVMRLRGLYMQGLYKRGHKAIFDEMKTIAENEGLKIYCNSSNEIFTAFISSLKARISL